MTFIFQKVDRIFSPLLLREKDPINRARIKMLSYILMIYPTFMGILIVFYLLSGETLHLIRVSLVFAITLFLLGVVYFTNAWRLVSHIILWVGGMVIWSSLLIFVQDIDIEIVQYIWLGCMVSFYMLGSKWGLIYSCLFILPVIFFAAIGEREILNIGFGPIKDSALSYLLIISYNFLLIIYFQYYFFREFTQNFSILTQTKNELRDLNQKLKITLQDVEHLSNSRMEFLSTMSHELRTPLNGVVGMTDVLLQNPRKDQEENLALLKFSTENLLSLINDVLNFNKLESDNVALECVFFNLFDLLKNNCASLEQKARQKSLQLSYGIDKDLKEIRINSDPIRLTQVVSNLLNNAINFTEKGFVRLLADVHNISEDKITVRFVIQDSGIGIQVNKQKKIFEPYVQASSYKVRHNGGSGLGLPIVKKTLAMFDSSAQVESSPEEGTEISFIIDFPYDRLPMEPVRERLKTRTDLGTLKVLVAEDNAVNVLVIKKTLEKWNIIPVIAKNGQLALQKLKQEHFDLILMDLFMPVMDGFEATAHIRRLRDPLKAAIPIVALTAKADEKLDIQIKEASIDDYLTKPFNPDHLFSKLKEIADHKIQI